MGQNTTISQEALSRLRWRCRRGLLESELIINQWLNAHSGTITHEQANALARLLDLSDNDLLDLLLCRSQPQAALATPAVLALLREMQRPGTAD